MHKHFSCSRNLPAGEVFLPYILAPILIQLYGYPYFAAFAVVFLVFVPVCSVKMNDPRRQLIEILIYLYRTISVHSATKLVPFQCAHSWLKELPRVPRYLKDK